MVTQVRSEQTGFRRGTQLPKVIQLFRDKDGLQIPVIRLQTPFVSDTLCQTGGGQAGFMGCLNTTLRVRGQAKSTLPQRPPWMLRDSASSPFPTQPPLNPALGLTRLRGCLLRSSASCPSSFQWPGPWCWLRSQGPPWDFSLAGIPGWPVFWSCKPAPLQLWGNEVSLHLWELGSVVEVTPSGHIKVPGTNSRDWESARDI